MTQEQISFSMSLAESFARSAWFAFFVVFVSFVVNSFCQIEANPDQTKDDHQDTKVTKEEQGYSGARRKSSTSFLMTLALRSPIC
jgi:hypothetical protein